MASDVHSFTMASDKEFKLNTETGSMLQDVAQDIDQLHASSSVSADDDFKKSF